jgi:hypothetical protein
MTGGIRLSRDHELRDRLWHRDLDLVIISSIIALGPLNATNLVDYFQIKIPTPRFFSRKGSKQKGPFDQRQPASSIRHTGITTPNCFLRLR